jgi:hypothetical protein
MGCDNEIQRLERAWRTDEDWGTKKLGGIGEEGVCEWVEVEAKAHLPASHLESSAGLRVRLEADDRSCTSARILLEELGFPVGWLDKPWGLQQQSPPSPPSGTAFKLWPGQWYSYIFCAQPQVCTGQELIKYLMRWANKWIFIVSETREVIWQS